MLTLPIKKKWFDMIVSGEKKEEYRTINEYYGKRFQKLGLIDKDGFLTDNYARIILRNGYGRNVPEVQVVVSLGVGYGWEKWGADPYEVYYILRIMNVFAPSLYVKKDGEK